MDREEKMRTFEREVEDAITTLAAAFVALKALRDGNEDQEAKDASNLKDLEAVTAGLRCLVNAHAYALVTIREEPGRDMKRDANVCGSLSRAGAVAQIDDLEELAKELRERLAAYDAKTGQP